MSGGSQANPEAGAPVLEVEQVERKFGSLTAVDNLSFQVAAGEVCGFIGPNGAGKTTTMRCCATLDMPDKGDVRICGTSALMEPGAARRRIGYMPDSYGTYANTTVFDSIDFFARAQGLRGRERRRAVESVSDFTGLTDLLPKLTKSLSKGMRQRLGLARTLLHDPALLILDEPAAGLDPRARIELRELVGALADRGKAVLISSHILSELGEMASHLLILEKGRMIASGPVEDLQQGRDSAGEQSVQTQELFVKALCPRDAIRRFLAERPFVDEVRIERDGLRFRFGGDQKDRADLIAGMVAAELEPIELSGGATRLEDVFLRLTEGEVQ